METPSSIRRVTRSQALAASANNSTNIPMSKKAEGTEKGVVKSKQRTGQERSALFDITNDSPIVGLAMGSLETPSSYVSKRKNCGSISKNVGTPGSGEALLRGQVKTLLQKVEEEAVISKISVDRPFYHGVVIGLAAPTPNNTPQVSNFSGNGSVEKGLESVTSSPVPEQFAFPQIVTEIFEGQKKEESVESEKITRTLLFDFSEKSEGSVDSSSDCTSVLTYDGASGASKVKSSTDDDDASIWSIQVNASTKDEEDDDLEDEVYDEEEEEDYDEEEEEDYCDDAILDGLCEGLSKVSVNAVEFAGKHTRFVYNSDDELEGEADCDGVLKLKGLPTPKGKHVRFPLED
ncbi:Chalcone-flavanone isomerase family protein [Heracleum sosnowskyi]|uniref:Chalcone-flavanone isomerase family protein n=1 Tax=Heracleum sosnowskyi TaxID=360622 RepID=A0AAD8M2Y5_9APIA|nr:Chalcone-flavanone isomerase family protein [Heracleum sosnowskyi]